MPEQGVLRVENGFPIVSPEAGVFPCSCASLSRGCCVFARACVVKASLVQHSVRCLSTVQDGLPLFTHHMQDMETGARAAELGDAAAAVPNPSQTRAAGLFLSIPPPFPLFLNCATCSSTHTRRLPGVSRSPA
jgi:hypothetical protein